MNSYPQKGHNQRYISIRTMEGAFLEQGSSVGKGENARLSSTVGAIAIQDDTWTQGYG
jgi:hypothetical protein